VLRDLQNSTDERLIVGLATGDDAGVFRLSESAALVQTLDFFTPVVDDPYRYGQIAATNSLSDVYAMGGTPLTAMNIVCFPIHDRDPAELAAILRGGADKMAEAGVALVGGHSVDDPEPKYGLSVTGLVDPNHITTNAGARPGDVIVLTKPLGTGIVTTAAKFDECSADVLDAACESMATLNAGAAEAMRRVGIGPEGIHAATDITGFALMGHLYHLAKASNVRLELDSSAIPILPGAEELAAAGNVTRGGKENAAYLADVVRIEEGVGQTLRDVLFDPQTSGGLAICVAEAKLDVLLSELAGLGVKTRAVIGRIVEGVPGIDVLS
jgi:selenide,water dikinase